MRQNRGYFAEIFADDWSDHADPSRAHTYEPGHLLEWAWLLDRARSIGIEMSNSLVERLATTGMGAVAPDCRLLPDEVNARSGNFVAHFRLWPQTEALKVSAMPGLRDKVPLAGSIADLILRNFLAAPFDGGWIDRRDAAGASLVDHVPASSLYHLMLAAASSAGYAASGSRTNACMLRSGSTSGSI
jgi:mannose-6-phosphate isomerase